VALTLTSVLLAIEIVRRAPRLLLLFAALFAYLLVLYVWAHLLWLELALAAVIAWKLGRGAVRGWREAR
jgi:hypothetical protein